MKNGVKIKRQKKHDRYVFMLFKNNELVGLNYHQGIDDIDYDFSKNDEKLMVIFKTLRILKPSSNKKLINKTLDINYQLITQY